MKHFSSILIGSIFLLFTASCVEMKKDERETEVAEEVIDESGSEASEDASKPYRVKGQIVAIEEGANEEGNVRVTVDHENIPGFMKAMRMKFMVSQAEIGDYENGDKVVFDLTRTDDYFMMSNLERLDDSEELEIRNM